MAASVQAPKPEQRVRPAPPASQELLGPALRVVRVLRNKALLFRCSFPGELSCGQPHIPGLATLVPDICRFGTIVMILSSIFLLTCGWNDGTFEWYSEERAQVGAPNLIDEQNQIEIEQ